MDGNKEGLLWSMDGRTDGRMDGWIDGRMDGWIDGRMDGWMDGWIIKKFYMTESYLIFNPWPAPPSTADWCIGALTRWTLRTEVGFW